GELLADLGEPEDRDGEIVLHGGSGTLVMRWRGNAWTPAPTLRARVAGVAGAVVDAAAAIVTGDEVVVAPDEYARRLAVCAACPMWNETAGRCRVCGCFTRAKASLARASCPEGKW
ncbi:MAG TPA: DUF6171 family protein, partial [Anaeromyxobacteraceae bacterium]|nr:DUF6171 family protein [Anaeromyxobacteraceae bacterium]